MKKEIVINASKDRSRIAIVEDGQLVELYVENPDNVRTIGNVYLGRVQKVVPNLKAAFVDIGQKKDCYLGFSDLTDNFPQLQALAGEEVPGLDEPVLSLAPAKRVADDDLEPDVEDTLEVASGADAEEEADEDRKKTSSRGRGRRRSRGRGRGRGRGRRSEEEEQEEDRLDATFEEEEQEEGRRRLPPVLDLTSPPKRRPAKKTEAPTAEEPTTDEPEAQVTETNGEAEAPKKARKTRAKKAEPADDAPEATDEPAEETAPRSRGRAKKKDQPADDAPEADDSAEEADDTPSGRSRGRRSTKKADDAAPTDAEADADADTDDSSDEESAESSGGRKRSRRRRRGRRGRGRNRGSDDASSDDEADDKPTRATRSKKQTDESDQPEAEEADQPEAEAPKRETPKRKTRKPSADTSPEGAVSPTGRSRRPAASDIEDAADASDTETADEPAEEEAPAPTKRSRRGKRASEPTADDASDESADETSGGRKRLPRTLDLTGASAKPSAKKTSSTPDDDDEPAEGRSRRRSRGGRSKDAEATTDAKADDTSDQKDEGRSRRRGRRTQDDARASDSPAKQKTSDDRSSKDDVATDDSRSRGRGGRRSDDAKKGDRGRQKSSGRSSGRSGKLPSNEELLSRGNRIIVKITKEAISNKGPRVSTDLSLAGRFLVLVPAADYVAVSKKIESAKERRRLRTLASSLKPDRFGVIVRTVAEGRDAKSLDQDLRLLVDKWRKIQDKLEQTPEPPVLLYQDVNMVSSIIRDLFSEDYDRILVDDPKVFKNVQAYVKAVAPAMADKVELHKGRTPVYRAMGIEKQVEEAFSKRVNMRGGGYLYIETTEAMHVVDVNSGRAGRGKSQKQTLIDVNVEAAREVAKQLRLRDLGGIIVVDFIDLRYDRDRKKVTDALKEAFTKDRAVTKLLPMSDFGLVQITRQRLRPSITANATDDEGEPLDPAEAAAAAGAGEIRRKGQPAPEPAADDEPDDRSTDDRPSASRDDRPQLAPEDATPRALAGRLRGWLDHYRATVDDRYKGRPIAVKVHPLFGSYLRRGFPSPLTRWRLALRGITFVMEEDASVDPLAFEVRDQKSGRSLLKKYAQ